jgi:hypothetical protein
MNGGIQYIENVAYLVNQPYWTVEEYECSLLPFDQENPLVAHDFRLLHEPRNISSPHTVSDDRMGKV